MATETQNSAAIAASSTATGTATGQEKERASGEEDERLRGADKRPAPEGAPKSGDFAKGDHEEPQGQQAEPAAFTTNGTIPSGMVSSPMGFVPASAVSDPEAALERTLSASGRNSDDRFLTEEEVEGLSGAEVRAIGHQRGYEPPEMAGARTQRRLFLDKQAEDKRFEGKKSLKAKVLGK